MENGEGVMLVVYFANSGHRGRK